MPGPFQGMRERTLRRTIIIQQDNPTTENGDHLVEMLRGGATSFLKDVNQRKPFITQCLINRANAAYVNAVVVRDCHGWCAISPAGDFLPRILRPKIR